MNSTRRLSALGAGGLAAGVYLMSLLLGCSSAESDWKKADGQGTVAAYQAFLQQHPNDSHAVQARDRVVALQDEKSWTDAHNTNTVAGYQQYLEKQPKGVHSEEAHEQITGIERAAAWKVAQADGSESALQGFVQKYASGPQADLARAQLEKLKTNDSRVQLATARSRAQAKKDRVRLQARYGKVVSGLTVMPPAAPEKLSRVVSAPMSAQDAGSACAKLKKLRQHCDVVRR